MLRPRAIGTVAALWLASLVFAGSSLAAFTLHEGAQAPLPGVNLPSGSFGSKGSKRERDYTYPTRADIDHFTAKGFKIFRISFLAKRVVAPDGSGGFAPTEDMRLLTELIDYAATKDASVILDMHDYGRSISGKLIGRDPGATEEFAASWRTIADEVSRRPNVIFGLMNEPNKQSAEEWLEGANAATAAIRDAGAYQLVLVPGSYWDSAHGWTTSDNATVMPGFRDPADNFVYEVHQYLDSDGSGAHTTVAPGAGAERLAAFTDWARKRGVRAVLGEVGWAANAPAQKEGRDMLCYMHRNKDVWLGWSYWAGGPWWGDYMFSVQPEDGVDKPQMRVLSEFVGQDAAPQC